MIVLASSSPERKRLLEEAGLEFRVVDSGIDEEALKGKTIEDTALLRARAKSKAVAGANPDDLVIGADTIVEAPDGSQLNKPATLAEARDMLKLLLGTRHRVVSACSVRRGHKEFTDVSSAHVALIDPGSEALERYLKEGECLNKAGGLCIRGEGKHFIDHVSGPKDVVVGLNVRKVLEFIDKLSA